MPPQRDAQGRFIKGSGSSSNPRKASTSLGGHGVRVVMDNRKLAEVLRGPSGPVARELLQLCNEAKREAVATAPVYSAPPAGPPRTRAPGTLRDSITVRIVEEGGGPVGYVGTADPVGLYVHEGTDPHRIVPRRAPRLVFWWGKVGKVVVAKGVNHPGTQPNRWIAEAVAKVMRRRTR